MRAIGLGIDFMARDNGALPLLSPPPTPARQLAPRAPRSLGIRGGFTSPAPNLPRTVYTRDPATNPLIPLTPYSPNLEIPLVQANPAAHLRAMKKRSIAIRNFGASAETEGSLEGLHGVGGQPHMQAAGNQDSPTVAASPTIAASPVVAPSAEAQHHSTSHPLYAASIALGVILGISALSLLAWLAFTYQRRRARNALELSPDPGSSPKLAEHELFSASNVVEKGLRPRSSSISSETTLRPRSIMSTGGISDGKRVSFMDVPVHTDRIIELHDKIYGAEAMGSTTRGRTRSSTLSAIERSLVSSRPPSTLTISTLDPIEEECPSLHTRSPAVSPSREVETPVSCRPMSTASTTSAGSSAYTTASARFSISDLTTMSTISCLSAFPQTPRSDHRVVSPEIETPTKSTPRNRQNRARSQTIVNVKHVDHLRTAVGKTMSLQPSKQVASALQQMSLTDNAAIISELIRGREELIFSTHRTEPSDTTLVDEEDITEMKLALDEKEECGDETLVVEDPREMDRPENGMKRDLYSPDSKPLVMAIDDETLTSSPVTRSRSFPSKLLARRRSEKFRGKPVETRRSEVITGGYLKRALRAFRGEDELPAMPGSFFSSMMGPAVGSSHRRDSSDSISSGATQGAGSLHTLNDVPFAPGWGYDMQGGAECDAYYMDGQDNFAIGCESDDESEGLRLDGYRLSDSQLPHIRITSH